MVNPRQATADLDDMEPEHDDREELLAEIEEREEAREQRAEKLRERQLQRRIQRIKSNVTRYVSISFGQLGVAGEAETASLLSGLHHISEDENDVSGWESFVRMLFTEHLASARILYSRLHRELQRGIGSISVSDMHEWESFFRSPSYDYKHKEYQIEQVLPHEIDQAIALRLERDLLLREPEAEHLSSARAVQDDALFLARPLSSRRTLIASLREDIRSLSAELRTAHGELRGFLVRYASGEKASISLTEAYAFLGRAFRGAESARDVEEFHRATIVPFLNRCDRLRQDYDRAEQALDRAGANMPAAFARRSVASFLALSPEARAAYIQSAESAARSAVAARNREEAEARLAEQAEKSARLALSLEDWSGAKIHIETLRRLDPAHKAVVELLHAADELEVRALKEEAVTEAKAALQTSLKTLGHTSLSTAYGAALEAGVDHFSSFAALVEHRAETEKMPAKSGPVEAKSDRSKEKVLAEELAHQRVIREKREREEEERRQREEEDGERALAEAAIEKKRAAKAAVQEKQEEPASTVDDRQEDRPEPPKRRVVQVDAIKAPTLVETVTELEEDDDASLVLAAAGETISATRQAEATKLHPWLKHQLGVLERHGARFAKERPNDLDRR
jgi:hypothetical protein